VSASPTTDTWPAAKRAIFLNRVATNDPAGCDGCGMGDLPLPGPAYLCQYCAALAATRPAAPPPRRWWQRRRAAR